MGARAESLVCEYLEARGYRVIERNVRIGRKELDIIARRGRTLVVCEVRARRTGRSLSPLETITDRKIRHIREGALAWLIKAGLRGVAVRFDAAAVTFDDPRGCIDYREDAF